MSDNSSASTETVELVASLIKFRVPNISKLQGKFFGPRVATNGLSFRPMVKPHFNRERRYTALGVYLCCSGDNGQPMPSGVTCTVNTEVLVCSQDQVTKPRGRFSQASNSAVFNAARLVYRFDDLIKWDELLDPRWVKDDVVMLQMSLQILHLVIIPPILRPGLQMTSVEVTTTNSGMPSFGHVMRPTQFSTKKIEGVPNCETQLDRPYKICSAVVQDPDKKYALDGNGIYLAKSLQSNDGTTLVDENFKTLVIKDEEDNGFELLPDAVN